MTPCTSSSPKVINSGLGKALEGFKHLAIPAFEYLCSFVFDTKTPKSESAFASAVEHRINQGGTCTIDVLLAPTLQYDPAQSKQPRSRRGQPAPPLILKQMVYVCASFGPNDSIKFEWALPDSVQSVSSENKIPCSPALACKVAMEQQRRLQELIPEAKVTLAFSSFSRAIGDEIISLPRALAMIEMDAQREGITNEMVDSVFPSPLTVPNLLDAFQDPSQ